LLFECPFRCPREMLEHQRGLGETLLELGVEAREVELIELTQVGAVRRVHWIPWESLAVTGIGSLQQGSTDTIRGTLGRPRYERARRRTRKRCAAGVASREAPSRAPRPTRHIRLLFGDRVPAAT